MKKLCRKGTVHPSPSTQTDDQFLSLLPVTILSLVAALTAEDREVLAYLISNSHEPNRVKKEEFHSLLLNCSCFSCYTSYWVRWDTSPNRGIIHQIIDAFEDNLEMKKKKKKKDRKKRSGKRVNNQNRLSESSSGGGGDSVVVVEQVKGPVEKIFSFVGQKVFGVWG